LVTNNNNDGRSVEKEELDLRQEFTPKDFSASNHFCIPLKTFWINCLLQDMLKLSNSVALGGT
jgi:hypothetical protein